MELDSPRIQKRQVSDPEVSARDEHPQKLRKSREMETRDPADIPVPMDDEDGLFEETVPDHSVVDDEMFQHLHDGFYPVHPILIVIYKL